MSGQVPRPYSLLAEITHRCPLHCPYCSNPTELASPQRELPAGEWARVLNDAAELGVLHVGFSGGEPLQRNDLGEMVAAARAAGLYTNLITSAVGLNRARAEALKAAGLDSVQISFQADTCEFADCLAGASAHAIKLEAARLARELGFPLTINVVLHRGNIGRMGQMIGLAEELGAERLELANAQYYGWAWANRGGLLPTRRQIEEATRIATEAKERLHGRMELLFVIPDYYSDRPKACMHGWATRHVTVNPAGDVLPCPTAGHITTLRFENVRERPLGWIWRESPSFNAFRGTGWMPEPCRSCEFREIDFGGCRCQAALLTGEAAQTDPVCKLSPHRRLIDEVLREVNEAEPAAAALRPRENVFGATGRNL
jgi:pyrroloquinoline quinone biosynthesis protein E